MPNLTDVLGSITETADWMKSGGILPVGRAALNAYLKRRSAEAQQILFEELRSGGYPPEQVAAEDDGIAVIHGYVRAAWEGRARVNLRLLAKAITGQLQVGTLVADEFYLYAESLAGLSRDEVILVSTLLRHHPKLPDVPEEEAGEREKQSPWLATMAEMEAKGWQKDKVAAVASRCLRSGFVIAQSAWGGLAFKVSPLLLDLSKTVDFDDALKREDSSRSSATAR
ncbi:hypothetical protein [Reyranella sp.]|uniref:hypothetical protein n=1 Tax=Reyranella sp. TaxID=1929291 RepID=UPI004036D579